MCKIAWATCWFNEPVDTLITFFENSLDSLNKLGYEIKPIIFAAQYKPDNAELSKIKENIAGVTILKNNVDIFPNKNYGLALIVKEALKEHCKYTAIVDSDWDIKESLTFVKKLLSCEKNDLIIPNIGQASGRSNLLIGDIAIKLFYPEYAQVIKSAFPGSVVGKTSKLDEIISSPLYHFDWGGEWDLISLGINKKMNIGSVDVDVRNVRHRCNKSKMGDSFQIWRSILGNNEILKRYDYLENLEISDFTEYKNCSNKELIELFEKDNKSNTEKQILYMILYPIAYLAGDIKKIPDIESQGRVYEKEELYNLCPLALYIAYKYLSNLDINKLNKRCLNIKGEYLSNWTRKNQKEALEVI